MCTSVAFGVGLGLKDGVGKASEFFAGYETMSIISCISSINFLIIYVGLI